MPKVSIIMPVYNVEKYIKRSIDSILAQTMADFEFHIVDDGSKDFSGSICDTYALQDNRIKVYHIPNGGAPNARNHALQHADGKYVYFMDSDDWAESNMLYDMVNLAEQNDAQLVITGFFIDYQEDGNKYLTLNQTADDAIFNNAMAFRREAYKLFDANLLYTPWNKLFLLSYIKENNIWFVKTIWDDFPFVLSVIKDVRRVIVAKNQYYHFMRSRSESETAKYQEKMYDKREEEHDWMVELYRYWGVSDANSMEMVARRYVERFVGCIENITCSDCKLPIQKKIKLLRSMLKNSNLQSNLKLARPQSMLMKATLIPVRMGSGVLCYCMGFMISTIKQSNGKLFAKLKASR